MKLIPYEMGGAVCGWHSDDAARLYWYKSEHTGSDRTPAAPERLTANNEKCQQGAGTGKCGV